MSRKGRVNRKFCHAKQSAATVPATSASARKYRAPTVGLKDQVFTIGKTKYASKFEILKEELGKHFAAQSWSDAADAARAFEIMKEPKYDDPNDSELPLCLL